MQFAEALRSLHQPFENGGANERSFTGCRARSAAIQGERAPFESTSPPLPRLASEIRPSAGALLFAFDTSRAIDRPWRSPSRPPSRQASACSFRARPAQRSHHPGGCAMATLPPPPLPDSPRRSLRHRQELLGPNTKLDLSLRVRCSSNPHDALRAPPRSIPFSVEARDAPTSPPSPMCWG